MEEISIRIASISLFLSLVALVWNIVRDLIVDRVKLSVRMFSCEEIIDGKNKRLVSAGSVDNTQRVEKANSDEKICFKITNIGRRDVEVDCIIAEYSDGMGWALVVDEKRYLKPYESTDANTGNTELKEKLKNKKVNLIYVKDTKDHKWEFSSRDIERLQ